MKQGWLAIMLSYIYFFILLTVVFFFFLYSEGLSVK